MSQGAVYFNAGGGSITPQQCTRRWVTTNSTLTENASGFARHNNVTAGARHLLGVDFVPASHTQIECLTKTRTDTRISGGIYGGCAARATGAGAAELGYAAVLVDNGGVASLRLYRFSPAGTSTALVTFAITTPAGGWAINEWWWVRLQLNGSTIRARCWKDGSAEGAGWDIDTTDANVTSGDWAGPYNFGVGNIDHDFFSFGTGGDAAPSPSTSVQELFDSASAFQPIGWREHWDTTNAATTEVSGGYARMVVGAQASHALAWDTIEPSANIEIVAKLRASAKTAGQPSASIILRGSGAAAAENGYRFALNEASGSELRVSKYTAGTASDIGTATSFTWATNTWYWLRARVNGSTLTLKAWADGAAEPASPQRSETDSSFSAAGFNGILGFVAGNLDVDYAAYAVAGAVATGPVVLNASQAITIGQSANLTAATAAAANLSASQTIAVGQSTNVITVVNIRPLIGCYYAQKQNANVQRLSDFLGFNIALAMEFTAYDTRTKMVEEITGSPPGFTSGLSKFWKDYNTANPTKPRRLYLSLPSSTTDGGITDALLAGGTTVDSYYVTIAQTLIADGHEDALIRIGWEMNLQYFPWGKNGFGNYRAAFQKIVNLFRAQSGQAFEFVFAPISQPLTGVLTDWYPGDAYVDWVAPDTYGEQWAATDKTPTEIWNNRILGTGSDQRLLNCANFAASHGKKFGVAESGSGWRQDRHGIGDTDVFWTNLGAFLTARGPATGALLGVFDQEGGGDYFSVFTLAENYTGTVPSNWYELKDRTAWAFRRAFGVLPDLSTSNFEANAPSGAFFTFEQGFGTPGNLVIPRYTANGQLLGRVNASVGEKLWALDAGEADGTSNSGSGTGQQVVAVTVGLFGGSPNGGLLTQRSGKNTTLMSGKTQVIGVRNGKGGININLGVSVVTPTAGSAQGLDSFTAGLNTESIPGWARTWSNEFDSNLGINSVFWTGRTTGVVRAVTNKQERHGLFNIAVGYQADIDVATQLHCDTVPTTGGPFTVGGLVVRGTGAYQNETGYAAFLRLTAGNVQELVVRKYVASVLTDIASAPFAFVANTDYELRLQVFGTVLKAKAWLASAAEPSTWTIGDAGTVTDSEITAPGWAGVMAFHNSIGSTASVTTTVITEFDYFGWNATGSGSPVPAGSSNLSATQPILVGQAANLNTAPAVTVGGIPIGTVGTGIYAGKKLVWGDDFNAEPLPWNWRPAITGNEKGNITGTYGLARSAARSGDSFNWAAFIDESFRGARHESPTDLPNTDTRSVSASVLSMTNSVRNASLDSHLSYVLAGGYKDQPDQNLVPKNITAALMSTPSFRFGGDGDFVLEFRFRVPSGTINGYHYGLWASGDWWPNYGELDVGEGWNAATRQTRSSLHISNTDGTSDVETTIVADTTLPTAPTFVQITAVKTGSKIEIFDDIATPGTLVSRGSYTDATRVGLRFRGAQEVKLTLAGETKLSGTGTYSAANWPKSLEVDWVRVWTPTSEGNATPWTELTPAVNTIPGGSWASTFPSAAAIYGFTPDIEEIYSLFDNEDNPGALQREASPIFAPAGMTVDTVGRTTTGTVPLTDGGRVGLLFMGTKTTGGPAKIAYKVFNVAPAIEKSLFNDCYAAIGETFSRTIAYTDFHSGNLGPHKYTVTRLSGPADFTITGSGTTSVTIAGTVATAQDSVFKIDCTNVLGQVTTVLRTVKARALPIHFHFSRGVYQHNGVNRADFAAAITAGNATYTMARPANATIYSRDRDGFLTSIAADNTPRISNLGINIEPTQTQLSVGSTAFDGRTYSNMTCVAGTDDNLINGPSGSKTADRVNETTATGSHYVQGRTGTNLPLGAGQAYVISNFVHKGSVRYVQLFGTGTVWPSNEAYVNFDLDRVRATRVGTAVSESGIEGAPFLGKGWFRIWFKAIAEASATAQVWGLGLTGGDANAAKNPSYAGDTNNFVYLWGSSCVAAPATGPTLQTFIQNGQSTAAAVTRPADALTISIPATCTVLRLVFDDGTSQDVTVTGGSTYAVPTTLPRGFIREMIGFTAIEANLSAYHTIAIVQSASLHATTLSPANIDALQPIDITQDGFITLGPIPSADIRGELGGLAPQAIVEMFEYDDRSVGGNQVVRWHNGTTIADQPITWQGNIYTPLPIIADGFQLQLQGTLPRPTLRAANIGGTLGAYLRTIADGIGAKVTRRRTIAKYMDAINFPDGNPNADPNAHFPDDIFYVARKASENAIFVELELAVQYDVTGVQLPKRQVIAGTCLWLYRGPDCGYSGPPVQTIEGDPTSDPTKDQCRKTLSACRARFGPNPLNTSAFPASSLIGVG